MKDKRKARRAAYEARQEKQGKWTVLWIAIVLVVLALCCLAYAIALAS